MPFIAGNWKMNLNRTESVKLFRAICPGTAEKIRMLYGGSVKPDNTKDLMTMPDIDGALAGGPSLETDTFIRIVNPDRQVPW
jgi:triosephosphate isomerase